MKGISIHFGLNKVSPIVYKGWEGKLRTCEADAMLMKRIALYNDFEVIGCFLTEKATRNNFKNSLRKSLVELEDGDFLLITFSGHGGKITDKDGDELDGKDEFWFLFDGIITDDYIYNFINSIEKEIRVLFISDSCFSGSMIRRADSNPLFKNRQKNIRKQVQTKAAVQLIASSKEEEVSWTSHEYSLFTDALNKVIQDNGFSGTYGSLFEEIRTNIPSKQHPVHLKLGKKVTDFVNQVPFKINF